MYVKYGSYQHSDGEVNIVRLTQQRVRRGNRNRLTTTRIQYEVEGQLVASSNSALNTAIIALEAAYADDGEDFGLYFDNGTATDHFLDSETSLNGVRILTLDYPSGSPGQFTTCRDYRIIVEAEYFNIESQIIHFEESLQFYGTSGPRWRWVKTLNSQPVQVVTNAKTTQTIVQRGHILGLQGWPAVYPAPLAPQFEHQDQRFVGTYSPQVININTSLYYGLRYMYIMELPPGQGVNGFPTSDYPGNA